MEITHKELVKIAKDWLGRTGYTIIVCEQSTDGSEIPDALGFGNGGLSCLIECKTNKKDLHRDFLKPSRYKDTASGMGRVRWYLVPEGLCSDAEIPDGWGLLFYNQKHGVRPARKPIAFMQSAKAFQNEIACLLSVIHAGIPDSRIENAPVCRCCD